MIAVSTDARASLLFVLLLSLEVRMNKRIGFVAAPLLAALILAACGGSPAAMTADDVGVTLPDAGGPTPDTGTASACANHIPDPATNPMEQFGTSNGRQFRPFTLNECDGTPYSFYGPEYCDAATRFTVVSIAAGWCGPCMMESAQLADRVVNVYGQDVRVVQIMVQDAGHGRPDAADCNAWVDTFGIINVELLDPDQITNSYFPDGSLPSTIIVNNQGTIVWHENGAVDGLRTLTDELNRQLGR